MPYSYPDKVPSWAKKKSDSVQKTAVEVFNETFAKTDSEEEARIASLAAMKNAEKANKKTKKSLISKSLNSEKRLATFVVLEPQDEDLTTSDLHDDWYDEETILDACLEFNKSLNSRKGSLMHMVETSGYSFVESYVTPTDMQVGDQFIKKGSWLATIKAEADWIWEGIKEGKFNGLSVECMGVVEEI